MVVQILQNLLRSQIWKLDHDHHDHKNVFVLAHCRTISMQAILIILRQSLSPLPHHWLTPSEIYLMMDKPRLHSLPLFSSITGRRHSRSVRWHKFV